MQNRMLRLQAVKAVTGLSRSTIYLRLAQGSFPRPVPLGGRAIGWVEAEVEAWIAAQIARSREGVTSSQGAETATSRVDNSTGVDTQPALPSKTETAGAVSHGVTGQRALAGFLKRRPSRRL